MALEARNAKHALQIQAGINGRKRGHEFEYDLADIINSKQHPINMPNEVTGVFHGSPGIALIKKALVVIGWPDYDHIDAISLGSLATAEEGKKWLEVNGIRVKSSKSDVLLNIYRKDELRTVGVSVKQCMAVKPTNPQLFLSTAVAFCNMLRRNGIAVSYNAEIAMQQFCGNVGFRPIDDPSININTRKSSPARFFWEEINPEGRKEWENIFREEQDAITRLLLQKAYLDDPYAPEILIQKTRKVESGPQEFAIYSIEEFISKSRAYKGFYKTLKTEVSKSKSYELEKGLKHECPKFGVVQMQRFGNKQNATQLQFNLQAGYFHKI